MVDGNIILSVAKAMELLQILSQAGKPLLLKELTALCGYPNSTVFGLLTTMRACDVVTQTPDGRYTLGLRLFEYGRQVERSWDISLVARPYMEHLRRETGASVMLSVYEGGSVITLDQVESREGLRIVSDIGSRLPVFCTSQGKVFLAHMSRAVLEREILAIPVAMWMEGLKVTPRAMLSRAVAGIRGSSLLLNLPGSEKAARENLAAVIEALEHGLHMIAAEGHE